MAEQKIGYFLVLFDIELVMDRMEHLERSTLMFAFIVSNLSLLRPHPSFRVGKNPYKPTEVKNTGRAQNELGIQSERLILL